MRASRIAILSVLLFAVRLVPAQVVDSVEINDPGLRAPQEESFNNLKTVGQNIAGYPFNFPFYFSRTLDIDEKVSFSTTIRSRTKPGCPP
jgi:hypothetical protein